MRQVFISYAREDKPDVEALVQDLNALGYQPWVDSSLRGGQAWWEEILRRIANCDVFVTIVSGYAVNSVACKRELEWALALNKPVLPLAVVERLPAALPRTLLMLQIVRYSRSGREAVLALAGALGTLPAAPPPPEPLPLPPAAPDIDPIDWDDLLGHIRQRLLVAVVGPDLTVVNVGNAEQTFTTVIGQRLAERYHLTVSPGLTTIDKAVAAVLRQGGPDEVERLYRVINDIIVELDPAPGDALRDLAAIDDLRLFVSTTPDRLLAKAVNEVRYQGRPETLELALTPGQSAFTPNQSDSEPSRKAQPAAASDTVVLNLFGQAASTPQYAIHEEDRAEWLRWLLSDAASLPDWLDYPLSHQSMLFIGCGEIGDFLGRLLLRRFTLRDTRLALERKQFFFVGYSGSHVPSLSDFSAIHSRTSRKPQVQLLEMAPTEFVAELRARWEEQRAARPAASVVPVIPPGLGESTIFISYMREDAGAARRLRDAITGLGVGVWLDERPLRPGHALEQEILNAIRQAVRLFVPIISANTERAEEDYVFREWREAVDRARAIPSRRFILPVIVDDDYEGDPRRYRQIPDDFGRLQFGRAPAGDPDAELLAMLTNEIRAMRRTAEA